MIEYLSNSLCRDLSLVLFGIEQRDGAGTSGEWLKRGAGHASFVLDVPRVHGVTALYVTIETSRDGETWTTAGKFGSRSASGSERIDILLDGFVRARFNITGAPVTFQVVGSL